MVAIEIWVSLTVSVLAIMITCLKDFILPWFYKPKFEFKYEEKPPFRRPNEKIGEVIINRTQNLIGTFLRFSAKNIGRVTALNCRCQILTVLKDGRKYGDYQGFPLKWASRPESVINQASGERLNIARGESEFIDIAVATNNNSLIHLQKYHSIPIGIEEVIKAGEYYILLIFSGDNFKPYKLKFHINREDSRDPNKVFLKLIKYWN